MTGYVGIVQLKTASDESVFFSAVIRQWAVAQWALSIAIQVSGTMLIAWRIWYIQIGTIGFHKNQKVMPIVWIILESGVVLSLAHVLQLAFYLEDTVLDGVVFAMLGQLDVSVTSTAFVVSTYRTLQTIVPTSILVRVAHTEKMVSNASVSIPPSHSWRVQQRDINSSGTSFDNGHELYDIGKVSNKFKSSLPRSLKSRSRCYRRISFAPHA